MAGRGPNVGCAYRVKILREAMSLHVSRQAGGLIVMNNGRNHFSAKTVIGSLVAAALAAASMPAQAQGNWPQRQVTIVVPFSAGGSADLIGRLVAQHLQAKFGTPFVIENRGGAGGSIAAAYVAKAPNDGYTLFIGTASTNAINPHLYRLPFDVERDF